MQSIRFLAGVEMFNTKVSGLDFAPTKSPTQWVAGVPSLGVNAQGYECGHLLLYFDEFKNKWRCIFTP
jgi:hypothetical protein